MTRALAAAQRILALREASLIGHGLVSAVSLFQKQYEQAISRMERAIALLMLFDCIAMAATEHRNNSDGSIYDYRKHLQNVAA